MKLLITRIGRPLLTGSIRQPVCCARESGAARLDQNNSKFRPRHWRGTILPNSQVGSIIYKWFWMAPGSAKSPVAAARMLLNVNALLSYIGTRMKARYEFL